MCMIQSWKLLWLLILGFVSAHPAVSQDVKEIKQTAALNADGRVVIDTFKGTIAVIAWDNPTVDIYARIEPDGSGPHETTKVQNTEVQINVSAATVAIKSDYQKLQGWSNGNWGNADENNSLPFIHYTIHMPRTAKLEIKDHKSKIQVTGLRSQCVLNTHKGTVEIAQFDGSLKLNTHKGDVRVQFAGLSGDSEFETHKGDIEIAFPHGRGFQLDSSLGRHGQLDANFDIQALLSKASRREKEYQGAVNGGGPRLRLRTFKGSFRLRQA